MKTFAIPPMSFGWRFALALVLVAPVLLAQCAWQWVRR